MAKRIIDSEIWKDTKWSRDMKAYQIRYLWFYLLTCPDSQSIGIFHLPLDVIAFQTKLDEEEIKIYLMKMHDLGMCEYDMETEEILIYNSPKYNICSWGKPMEDKIKSELSNVKNTDFISKMVKHLKAYVKKQQNDKKAELMAKVIVLYENALKSVENKGEERKSNRDIYINNNNHIHINNASCHDTCQNEEKIDKSFDELLGELEETKESENNETED